MYISKIVLKNDIRTCWILFYRCRVNQKSYYEELLILQVNYFHLHQIEVGLKWGGNKEKT